MSFSGNLVEAQQNTSEGPSTDPNPTYRSLNNQLHFTTELLNKYVTAFNYLSPDMSITDVYAAAIATEQFQQAKKVLEAAGYTVVKS